MLGEVQDETKRDKGKDKGKGKGKEEKALLPPLTPLAAYASVTKIGGGKWTRSLFNFVDEIRSG